MRSIRAATAASLAVAAGAATVMGAPAGAQAAGPATKAYLDIPAGSVFEPKGGLSVASTDTTFGTTHTDAEIQFDLIAGTSTFHLTVKPDTTTAAFPAGGSTFASTIETPDATHGSLTMTQTAGGSGVCNAPTGSFSIADLFKTGPNVDSVALRFELACDGVAAASGTVYVDQPMGPLGNPTAGEFVSMAPVRLLDTRLSANRLTAGGTVDIDVRANDSNVPVNAQAVVVNVTGVAPSANTFFSLFPKDQPPVRFVSNLNPRKDDNVANLATVKVGTDSSITLYNDQGTADAVVDIVGYYVPDNNAAGGDRYVSNAPVRKLDTRDEGKLALGPNEVRELDLGVTGTAAVLNVTVVAPTEGGYLTVYPASATVPPTASNINFVATQTIANAVVVKMDSGKVKLYNPAGTTHVVVDLLGTYQADPDGLSKAGRFVAIDPLRAYDSRETGGTPLANNEARPLNVLELGGKFPFEYSSFVANMTATDTTAIGFMTAYPRAAERPFASNLNWLAGETRPNQIFAGTDADGFTTFYNEGGSAALIVDVAGYFTQDSSPT